MIRLLFTTLPFVAAAAPRSGEADPSEATSGGQAAGIAISQSGSTPPAAGDARYFTGSVRVVILFSAEAPLRVSGATVTFQSGDGTVWHTHPLGQILIVAAGTGWVQHWGGPPQELREGDVVRIPPGVGHWHGATATTPMTHIALQEHLGEKAVDWMEPVSDAQYQHP